MPKNPFFKSRINSFGHAFRGFFYLVKTEINFQIHVIAAIFACIAGFYFELNHEEWMAQILAIGLVFGIEALNTAIEKLADIVQPKHDLKIKIVKDIAAGAVLCAAIAAIIVGLLIYLPKFK